MLNLFLTVIPLIVVTCTMNLLGNTFQISSGQLLTHYQNVSNVADCLPYCLMETSCTSVEHNYGSGDCKLYESFTSLYSVMNTYYNLYEKECIVEDDMQVGDFQRTDLALVVVQISTQTGTTTIQCAYFCYVNDNCDVFRYLSVDKECREYKLDMFGTVLCDTEQDCFIKVQ